MSAREQRARRRLRRFGFRLWKVRDNSRWWSQYGPYSLIDADRNMIVLDSMTIEQVEMWLNEP
jgi:hypothetical protein